MISSLGDDLMFKHLLVPLDGSTMAEAALPTAAFLCQKINAVVTLFHVIERNAPSEIHGQPHLIDAGEATNYLRDRGLRAFSERLHVDFHVHTAKADNVAESIVQHADELHCDLIIMCSHGRGHTLHLLLGSIAQEVLSRGLLPVLVIHPDKDGGSPASACGTLLVPLDGSPDHEQALAVSKELAVACGAVIHLAVVIPNYGDLTGESAVTSRFLPGTMTKMLELSTQEAEEYVESQAKELKSQGVESISHVLRGDPASGIDEAARRLQADLIVMATHGKSGMKAFWEGSVAHKVASRSRVPLLLIPVNR